MTQTRRQRAEALRREARHALLFGAFGTAAYAALARWIWHFLPPFPFRIAAVAFGLGAVLFPVVGLLVWGLREGQAQGAESAARRNEETDHA